MAINYIKLILRRLLAKPLLPVISVFGLAIGFSAILLVSLWIKDEFSYDNFHVKGDRVYRLTVETQNPETGFHWNFARSQYGWLRHAKEDVPGIDNMVRLIRWRKGVVKVEEQAWSEDIFSADQSIVDVFTLNFIDGSAPASLDAPKKVIISKSYAEKYFGSVEATGKTIYLYSQYTTEKTPFTVTGVFTDFPSNAHFHPHIIASLENPDTNLDWAYYYVLLNQGTTPIDVLASFEEFSKNYIQSENEVLTPRLQNIREIHLKSNIDRELEKNGSIREIKIVAGLALFVLLITLFNFFNLRYIFLLKESKALKLLRFAGAKNRGILFYQFAETAFYSLIAAALSIVLVWVSLPYFNQILDKVPMAGANNFISIACITGSLMVALASLIGILPIMFQKLGKTVRNNLNLAEADAKSGMYGNQSGILKSLVGLQYATSFILIVSVFVVQGQIKMFMAQSLGNNGEKILCIDGIPVQAVDRYQVLKQELQSSPLIYSVTSSMEKPGDEIRDMMGFETTGSTLNDEKLIFVSPVDDNFFDFYNIPIVAGNSFPEFHGDDSLPENYILNEKAIEFLGWKPEEAIGRPFKLLNGYMSGKSGRIVGVVKNFQPSSMKEDIRPYVYFQKSVWLYSAQVRYDTTQPDACIELIASTWKDIYPDHPLKYTFVDALYKDIYKSEFQLKNMSLLLCILALILSATGLFGITAITYQARTKEIGIRKVNGAKSIWLIQWLLGDILKVISISILLTIPIAYYLMHRWLENYVIHISPGASIFIYTSLALLGLALITVGLQTYKAANQNPVEALRYE